MPAPVSSRTVLLLIGALDIACAAMCGSTRLEGAKLVISNLFGSESSARAFARADLSHNEVQRRYASARKDLQYGEFDLAAFFTLLDLATPTPADRFVDLGSGCGRLVLAAALRYDWEGGCTGIEILADMHELAMTSHARLTEQAAELGVPLARCTLLHASVDDALPTALLADPPTSAVVFVYATCWPSSGPYLSELSALLGDNLPAGSRVVTVDKRLVTADDGIGAETLPSAAQPAEDGSSRAAFRLMHEVVVPNYNTGESTGYVYELVAPRGG